MRTIYGFIRVIVNLSIIDYLNEADNLVLMSEMVTSKYSYVSFNFLTDTQ